MKTVRIYSTTQGTTEKVAAYIAEKLKEDKVTIVKLKKNTRVNLSDYDRIILGGSIYLGEIQAVMSKFCNDNFEELLDNENLGIFVCGIETELIRQDEELEMAFPKKIFQHAAATAFVGGEIIFEKLNPTQKFIAKNMLKVDKSIEFFKYDAMDIFVNQLLA